VLDGGRAVTGVEISPDATELLTSGLARSGLYRCDLCAPVEELVDLSSTRVTRELTQPERARFLGEEPAP
jgi:hypothetical protein